MAEWDALLGAIGANVRSQLADVATDPELSHIDTTAQPRHTPRKRGRPPKSTPSPSTPAPSPHLARVTTLKDELQKEKEHSRLLTERVASLENEIRVLKNRLYDRDYNSRRSTTPTTTPTQAHPTICKVQITGDESGDTLRKKRKVVHDKVQELLADRFKESAYNVLECYVERHADMLQELCETVKDGEVQRAINMKYCHAVEEVWKGRSFGIKTRVAYSDEQYMRLKHMLGGTYNEEEDTYDDLVVQGICPPNLASLRLIRGTSDLLRKEMEITSFDNGATVSFIKKLQTTISRRQIKRKELWIQFAGDAARAGCIQQTAVSFRIMGVGNKGEANSPFTTYTVLLYEGDDSYNALASYTERLLKDMQQVLQHGLEVDGVQHTFTFFGGGDLKYINAILGLATCAHTYPCCFCVVLKSLLSRTDTSERKAPRNIQRATEMAHEAHKGTCPGCGVDLSNRAAVEAKKPQNDNQRLAYQTQHQGQRPHAAPLLPIQIKRMIPCILHVMLRLVDHLFTQTIRLHIDTDETETKVKAALKQLGIDVNPEKKIKKTQADLAAKKKLTKISFQGRACKSILSKKNKGIGRLNGYRQIIAAMNYPRTGEMTAAIALGLWESLEDLIDILSDQWDDEADMYDGEKQGTREQQAERAREAGTRYVTAVEHHFGADSVTLYMHVCAMHVPTFVRMVGSLSRWSMQAVEHTHSLRKKNRSRACNHKKVGAATRGGGTTKTCYMNTELTRQESLHRAHTDLAERPKKHHASTL